jgi:hypothetical protein
MASAQISTVWEKPFRVNLYCCGLSVSFDYLVEYVVETSLKISPIYEQDRHNPQFPIKTAEQFPIDILVRFFYMNEE